MLEKRTGENVVSSVKVMPQGVKVVLSSGEKVILSLDTYTEFHLYVGKQLEPAEYQKILEYAGHDDCYVSALRYVGRDMYSKEEIARKLLAQGYAYSTVSEVINRLEEQKLIDDVAFARTYADDVGDLRLIGSQRIIYDLRSKGIDESILSSLPFPKEKEMEKAVRLATSLDRRYYRTPYAKRVLKINSILLNRGFDGTIAHEAAAQATSASDPGVERVELEKAYHLAEMKFSRKFTGYELKQRIYAALIRKGFPHDEVKEIMEELQS